MKTFYSPINLREMSRDFFDLHVLLRNLADEGRLDEAYVKDKVKTILQGGGIRLHQLLKEHADRSFNKL